MARKRMIDPGIEDSPTITRMSFGGQALFRKLLLSADDAGVIALAPSSLQPVENFSHRLNWPLCERWINYLVDQQTLLRYENSGNEYLLFLKWFEYQSLDHPTPSKRPLPSQKVVESLSREVRELFDKYSENYSRKFQEGLREDSFIIERKGKEEKGREEKDSLFDNSFRKELEEKLFANGIHFTLPLLSEIIQTYREEDILEAVGLTIRANKTSLSYVRSILQSKKRQQVTEQEQSTRETKRRDQEAQEQTNKAAQWEADSLPPETNLARLKKIQNTLTSKMAVG